MPAAAATDSRVAAADATRGWCAGWPLASQAPPPSPPSPPTWPPRVEVPDEGSFGRGSGFLVQAEAEGSPYVCVTPPMAGSVPDFFAPSGLLDSSSGKLPASMQQQQNAALGASSSAVRAGVADEQEPPKALLAAKTTRGRGLATALVLLALGSAGAVLVARHLAKLKAVIVVPKVQMSNVTLLAALQAM